MARARRLSFFFSCVLALSTLLYSQHKQAQEERGGLDEILTKTGKYCERLKKVAFDFVCHESIEEKTYFYEAKRSRVRIEDSGERLLVRELKFKRAKTATYLYDYQMVKRGKEGFEKRILLRENKRKRNQENAQLKLQRFSAKYLIYGPVGFLSEYWQDHFDYDIIGEETFEGRKAICMDIAPKSRREENYTFGKVWIDEEDHSILKIEWDQRSIKDFKISVKSRAGDLKRMVKWGAIYGIEKNGIRFPSRQYIEEVLLSPSGKKHTKYEVDILYDNYKFFIVETQVRIR